MRALFDTSSRYRNAHLGQVAVWNNTPGHYAATRVEAANYRGHGDALDELAFTYAIQPNRPSSFVGLII